MPVTCGSHPEGPPSAVATAPLPPADRRAPGRGVGLGCRSVSGITPGRAARDALLYLAVCPLSTPWRAGRSQALVMVGAEILPGFLSRSSLL